MINIVDTCASLGDTHGTDPFPISPPLAKWYTFGSASSSKSLLLIPSWWKEHVGENVGCQTVSRFTVPMRTAICDEHHMPRTERSRHHGASFVPRLFRKSLAIVDNGVFVTGDIWSRKPEWPQKQRLWLDPSEERQADTMECDLTLQSWAEEILWTELNRCIESGMQWKRINFINEGRKTYSILLTYWPTYWKDL